MTPLVDRLTDVLGVTPTAVRVVPALAGGAVVVLAARFAALFGAGTLGRVLAALLTACTPVLLSSDHLGNTTPLDVLTWPVVGLCVAVALLRGRPLVPVTDVHSLPSSAQHLSNVGDTVGWPQLVSAVAAQDAALTRAGEPPTSIFTGAYGEAGALDVLGPGYRLPPVLSGHNAYWMWGPGQASDRTVLVVDALGQVRRYFASCRTLATVNPPYYVRNDWTDLRIAVCTGPSAGWPELWPRLRHYG